MSFKKVKIKDLVNLINGYPFKPEDWGAEGKKIIRIQNLNNPEASYNFTNKKVANKYIVEKSDVLIAWSGSLGVYEWQSEEKAIINQHLFKVEFKSNKIDRTYFRYVIRQALIELALKARGVGLKHLKKAQLDNYEFDLPDLIDQKKSVAILDKVSNLISKRKRTISLLDEYLKSSFLNLFGNPILNNKEWPKLKLKILGEVVTGNTPPRSNKLYYSENEATKAIEWLKSNNISTSCFFNSSSKEWLTKLGANVGRSVPENSTLIISISGSKKRLGDCCLTKGIVAFNQQINAFVPNQFPYFFYFLLSLHKPLFQNKTVNGMKQLLTKSSLQKVEVIYPDEKLGLQKKFNTLFEKVLIQHEHLMNSLNILEEYLQVLLYETFNSQSGKGYDELDTLMNDDIQLELFLNTINSSDFESDEHYNILVNKLYEILNRTEVRNQMDSKNIKGIIQRKVGLDIILETNKEYKYRLIDEVTSN